MPHLEPAQCLCSVSFHRHLRSHAILLVGNITHFGMQMLLSKSLHISILDWMIHHIRLTQNIGSACIVWPKRNFTHVRHVCSSFIACSVVFTGGQVLSAIIGCCVRLALGKVLWLSAALGMSLALVGMMLTRTTHPPGALPAACTCSLMLLYFAGTHEYVDSYGVNEICTCEKKQ